MMDAELKAKLKAQIDAAQAKLANAQDALTRGQAAGFNVAPQQVRVDELRRQVQRMKAAFGV